MEKWFVLLTDVIVNRQNKGIVSRQEASSWNSVFDCVINLEFVAVL